MNIGLDKWGHFTFGEALGGHVAEDLGKSRANEGDEAEPKEDAVQWLDRFGKNTMGEAVAILAAGSVGSLFGPSGRLVGHRIGLIVSKQVKWHNLSDDPSQDDMESGLADLSPHLLLQDVIAYDPENRLNTSWPNQTIILTDEQTSSNISIGPMATSADLLVEPPVQFTERQLEVLVLLAAQCDTNEIAAQLGITPSTVNYHKRNIHQKLGVQPEEGAVYTAVELLPHLLDDETE